MTEVPKQVSDYMRALQRRSARSRWSGMTAEDRTAAMQSVRKHGKRRKTKRHNDGGTCNMDTPAFRLPGVPASVVAEASTSAGVPAESFRWFGGKVWYWLRVPLHGQANRRSTMMTAAQRVLDRAQESGEVAGLESCGYYEMD